MFLEANQKIQDKGTRVMQKKNLNTREAVAVTQCGARDKRNHKSGQLGGVLAKSRAALAVLAVLVPMGHAYADNLAVGGESGQIVPTFGGATAAPPATTGDNLPASAGADGTSRNEAFGIFSNASGGGATAVGDTTTATGTSATTVGVGSVAQGNNAIAYGGFAHASADGASAIGVSSVASAANSIAVGTTSSATAANAIAFGVGATANIANSVAIGTGAVTSTATAVSSETIGGNTFSFAGAAPVGVVSVGSAGNERQIQNVAAGQVAANSTDAVNGSQLFATNQEVSNLFSALQAVSAGGGTGSGGTGSGGTGTGGTGTGGGTATGANSVAVGQNATASGTDSSADGGGAAATGNESTAMGAKAVASADNATATGANSFAAATKSTATGAGASASGDDSTAIGANSNASASNSVALGAGSVANQANTVSVGSAGNERRVTNVAPGINPTDAANVQQLQGVQQGVNSVARKAYSGVAGAVALSMIPDVDPGKTLSVGIGSGDFEGYAAVAVGATARIADNIKIRGGVSTSSAGTAFGGGVSYQW